MRARYILPLLLAGFSPFGAGCGVHTRAAVQNSTDRAVDVVLSRGDESVTFSAVAPGTTSDYQKLDWSAYDGVSVVRGEQQSTVDMQAERDNLLDLDAEGGIKVNSLYNEDNEYW